MTAVTRLWPLLAGTHRYDKSLSTRGRGAGTLIEVPILAYLLETRNGRILYDTGCDCRKLDDPAQRAHWYDGNADFAFGAPRVDEDQRLPARLARLGLAPADVDCVLCGHLHFDHAGGLHQFTHAEVHVHAAELAAARAQADSAYFAGDFDDADIRWQVQDGDYDLCAGLRALETPGHTAGHLSLYVELPRGMPVILCGDAADLTENLVDEVAPGLCWQDRTDLALASIRRLKRTALDTCATLWPNHDFGFFRRQDRFPGWHD